MIKDNRQNKPPSNKNANPLSIVNSGKAPVLQLVWESKLIKGISMILKNITCFCLCLFVIACSCRDKAVPVYLTVKGRQCLLKLADESIGGFKSQIDTIVNYNLMRPRGEYELCIEAGDSSFYGLICIQGETYCIIDVDKRMFDDTPLNKENLKHEDKTH